MSFGGFGGAGEALSYFIKAYDSATPVFRAFGAEVESVTKKVQASVTEINRAMAAQSRTVMDAAAQQEAALGRVGKSQVRASDEAIKSARAQAAAAKEAQAASGRQAEAAQAAATRSVKAANETEAAFGRSGSAISKMGRNIIIATAAVGTGSIDMAAKFQANTLRMQTQAGATTKQLDLIRQGLLKMSGQVGSTPEQLANGMYHVVSAMNQVLPPTQRVRVELEIMKAAAEGAQVGHSHLEDTTYALASAMNALHAGAGQAMKIMGELNATVGSGDMTMQDLIDAYKSGLIPTAREFGTSLASVNAALAVMGDMGMRGALAGTRLRMAMSLLGAPTKQAAGILETLGMTSKQAIASTEKMSALLEKAGVHLTTISADLRKPDGLKVALEDLDSHLKSSGLSAEGAGAAISRAFGGGRMGAAVALLAENTNRIGLKFDYINQKSADFGKDWQKTSKTFRVELDKALASLEALGITIGNQLLPPATDALHVFEDTAKWFIKNDAALKILGGTIITFASVAVGSYLISKLRTAVGLMKDLGGGVATMGRWMFGSPGGGGASPVPIGGGPTGPSGIGGGLWGANSTQIRVGSMLNPLAVRVVGAGGLNTSTVGGATSGVVAAESSVAPAIESQVLATKVSSAEVAAGVARLNGMMTLYGETNRELLGIERNIVTDRAGLATATTGPAVGIASGGLEQEQQLMTARMGQVSQDLSLFPASITKLKVALHDLSGEALAAAVGAGEISSEEYNAAIQYKVNEAKTRAAASGAGDFAEQAVLAANQLRLFQGEIARGDVAAIEAYSAARQAAGQLPVGVASLQAAEDQAKLDAIALSEQSRSMMWHVGLGTPRDELSIATAGLDPHQGYFNHGNIYGWNNPYTAEKSHMANMVAPGTEAFPGAPYGMQASGYRISGLPLYSDPEYRMPYGTPGSLGYYQAMMTAPHSGIVPPENIQMVTSWEQEKRAFMASKAEQQLFDRQLGQTTQSVSLFDAAVIRAEEGLAVAGEQLSLGGIATTNPFGRQLSKRIEPITAPMGSIVARPLSAEALAADSLGAFGTIKSGLSTLGGGLMRGGTFAGMGLLGAQMLGGAIGGKTGSSVSSIGTGASIGGGIGLAAGSIIPGLGTAVGGALGTALGVGIATAIHLLGSGSYGKDIANALTKGFGGSARDSLGKQLSSALDDAKNQLKGTRLADGLGGKMDPVKVPIQIDPSQLTPDKFRRYQADLEKAGQLVAKQLEAGWNQYKFQSEPVMFEQFRAETRKLPPIAQEAALASAVKFSQTLEKEKRLPVGSTKQLIDDIKNQFPGLVNFMGLTAQSSVASFTKALDFKQTETQLKSQMGNIANDFSGVRLAMDQTKGDTIDKAGAMINALQGIVQNGTGPMKVQATADLKALTGNIESSFTQAGGLVSSQMKDIRSSVATNSQAFVSDSSKFWGQYVGIISSAETAGAITVAQGNKLISQEMAKALQALGVSAKDAKALSTSGFSFSDITSAISSSAQAGIGGAGNNPLIIPAHATGGRVPGAPGGDNWTLMDPAGRAAGKVGGGELIIANQHTADDISYATRMVYNKNVDQMVSGEHRTNTGLGGGGYATGGLGSPGKVNQSVGAGYTYPLSGFSLGRTDMGVDASAAPGTPIGPIGRSKVGGIQSNWFKGQPYINWQLLDGPAAGRWVYVAEQITNLASPGSIIQANEAVARFAGSGTGIEMGWSMPGPGANALASSHYTKGQVTAEGSSFRSFIGGLTHGAIQGLTGKASGSSGGVNVGGIPAKQWHNIKTPQVGGSGLVAALAQGAIDSIAAAANAQGRTAVGQFNQSSGAISASGFAGQGGSASANEALGHKMMLAAGWGEGQWSSLLALWNQESGWNANAVNPSSGAYGIPQSLGHGHPYALGNAPAQIAWGLNYIRGRYGSPSAAEAHERSFNWYNTGGVAKMMGGGWVPGSPHMDGTPALLSGNEFVMTGGGQSMMESMAPGLLDYIASSQPAHFQNGGFVDYAKSRGPTAPAYPGAGVGRGPGGQFVALPGHGTSSGGSGSGSHHSTSQPYAGYNPLTGKVEKHTAAEWRLIHAKYTQQRLHTQPSGLVKFYDATASELHKVPKDAGGIASYLDNQGGFSQAKGMFPNIPVLSISVSPGHDIDADIYDAEGGGKSVAETIRYFKRRLAAGKVPGVYASAKGRMSPIMAAANAAGIHQSKYLRWVADWNGSPTVPAGMDAHQYASSNTLGYDTNVAKPRFFGGSAPATGSIKKTTFEPVSTGLQSGFDLGYQFGLDPFGSGTSPAAALHAAILGASLKAVQTTAPISSASVATQRSNASSKPGKAGNAFRVMASTETDYHGYRGPIQDPAWSELSRTGLTGGTAADWGISLGGLPNKFPLKFGFGGKSVIARKGDIGAGDSYRPSVGMYNQTRAALGWHLGNGLVDIERIDGGLLHPLRGTPIQPFRHGGFVHPKYENKLQNKFKNTTGFLQKMWGTAAPWYHRSGSPMPPVTYTQGNDALFVGVDSGSNTTAAHRQLFVPDWIVQGKTGLAAHNPTMMGLMLHEWTHEFQRSPIINQAQKKLPKNSKITVAEGGAQAFAQNHIVGLLSAMGIKGKAYMNDPGDPYTPMSYWVRNHLGNNWIENRQFGLKVGGFVGRRFQTGGSVRTPPRPIGPGRPEGISYSFPGQPIYTTGGYGGPSLGAAVPTGVTSSTSSVSSLQQSLAQIPIMAVNIGVNTSLGAINKLRSAMLTISTSANDAKIRAAMTSLSAVLNSVGTLSFASLQDTQSAIENQIKNLTTVTEHHKRKHHIAGTKHHPGHTVTTTTTTTSPRKLDNVQKHELTRLQQALQLVEYQEGLRIGVIVKGAMDQASALSGASTRLGRLMTRKGIDSATVQGSQMLEAFDNQSVSVLQNSVAQLQKAYRLAQKSGNKKSLADIASKLASAEDQLDQAITDTMAQHVATIEAAAQGIVDEANRVPAGLTSLQRSMVRSGISDTSVVGSGMIQEFDNSSVATLQSLERQLQQQYGDVLATGNTAAAKQIGDELTGVLDQLDQAVTDAMTQRVNVIKATAQSFSDQSASAAGSTSLLSAIQDLKPGTNLSSLGLSGGVLDLLGIGSGAQSMEGSSISYLSNLQQQQNGKLTQDQITAAQQGTAAVNAQIQAQINPLASELTYYQTQLPNLTGQNRTDAVNAMMDLAKTIAGLDKSINDNNDALDKLTTATNANTSATMTGTVAFTYQNQNYTAGMGLSSENTINLGLGS